MPSEARVTSRPVLSLGGVDGLDLHRRIIRESLKWLNPNGHLVIGTRELQAAGTAAVTAVADLPHGLSTRRSWTAQSWWVRLCVGCLERGLVSLASPGVVHLHSWGGGGGLK